jgi:hypothetical protein
MVVLDDDPTGIQTVHGCLLITRWDEESVRTGFEDSEPFFYILTNTRAMTREEAERVTREAMEMVVKVNQDYGYRLIVVSRSDSCLRGHFPLETDVMRECLKRHGYEVAAKTPFCPAFIEAGRVTIDGIHYMLDGKRLIPVSQTDFARDNVFAYHTSILTEYIKEKGANPEDYEIVNAESYDELRAFARQLTSPISHHPSAITHLTSLISPQCFRAPTDNDKSFGNWLAKDWKRCGLDTLRIPMTTAIDGNQLTFTFEIPDTLPPLPRLGIVIRLPREYEQLTWQGRGPWDNYPDRKTSCPVGLWQSTVSQQYVHYPRPQDSGNHEDCTLVELKTNDGRRLRIEAVGDAFSFSALPYSAQYLASNTHDYQLQDQGYTYLSIDCAVMGLGNSSCGPGVLKKYTIDPKQKHQLKIRITE